MKRFIIDQSDKEFYTSHSGLALVGVCINELCSLPTKAKDAFPVSPGSGGIGLDDDVRSYVGLLTLGQSDYEAVVNQWEPSAPMPDSVTNRRPSCGSRKDAWSGAQIVSGRDDAEILPREWASD